MVDKILSQFRLGRHIIPFGEIIFIKLCSVEER